MKSAKREQNQFQDNGEDMVQHDDEQSREAHLLKNSILT